MSDEKKDETLSDALSEPPRDAVGGEELPHETYGEVAGKPVDGPEASSGEASSSASSGAAEVAPEVMKSGEPGSGTQAAGEAGPLDQGVDSGPEGDVGSAQDAPGVESPADSPQDAPSLGDDDAPSGDDADADDLAADDSAVDADPADAGGPAQLPMAEPASDPADGPSSDDSSEPGPEAEPAPAPLEASEQGDAETEEPVEASEGPSAPSAPSGEPEAASEAPSAPSLGEVRGEVSELQQLPGEAVSALRDGGIALFIFLARLEQADDGLQGEALARLQAVKTATVQLLAAVERVFVRQG